MLFDRVNVHLKIYVRLKDVSYNCGTVVVVSNGPDDAEEQLVNEAEISTEFDAWNELRL